MARKHFSFDDEPSTNRTPKKSPSKPVSSRPKTQNSKQTSQKEHFSFGDEGPRKPRPAGSAKAQSTVKRPQMSAKAQAAQKRPTVSRPRPKQKAAKAKGIKKWQIVLVMILAAVVAFTGSMIYMAREDGPVYGNRCKGLVHVDKSVLTKTISEVKAKNKLINTINISIQCKEFKFDIDFNHATTEAQAKNICKSAVQTLDKNANQKSYKGSKYSVLLNKVNGVKQFECDFYLTCAKGDSWPIYGTKMAGSDSFNFSNAKIKNRTSYNNAMKNK